MKTHILFSLSLLLSSFLAHGEEEFDYGPQDKAPALQLTEIGMADDELINLNRASLEELIRLPGVKKDTALNIIKKRPYKHSSDILNVSGVNRDLYDRIKYFIDVW